MQTAAHLSNCSARESWLNARYVRIVFLLLTMTLVGQELSAQQSQEGFFKLKVLDGTNGEERKVQQFLDHESLRDLLENINGEIKLKQDVLITFGPWPDGEEPNAVYFPEWKQILISYGLIVKIVRLFRQWDEGFDDNNSMDFHNKIFPNVVQTLLHEIGHALIDVNDVRPKPATKAEEEVLADQLAFFVMSELYVCQEEDCEKELSPVVDHYLYRYIEGAPQEEFGPGNAPATDSAHPDDDERAEKYICWMDGKWAFDELLGDKPELGDCENKYLVLVDEWYTRLESSWKY